MGAAAQLQVPVQGTATTAVAGAAGRALLQLEAQVQLDEELTCPITAELMVDPVIAADGQTYEREAMELWLEKHDTSPLTGRVRAATCTRPLARGTQHSARSMGMSLSV